MNNLIGLHIVVLCALDSNFLVFEEQLDAMFKSEMADLNIDLIATAVLDDHAHILVTCDSEVNASDAIERIMDGIEAITGVAPQEDIHVTLLPPWHVQILAAFVREQRNYHGKGISLEEELDTIFRPNAVR